MAKKLKNSIARLLLVAVIAAAACLLSGCGASLTVTSYTENGIRYNSYDLSIDNDTVKKMEASAINDADGKPYNVPDYFFALFSGFGFELVDAGYDDKAFNARYRKAFYGATQQATEPAQFAASGYLKDISTQLDYTTDSTSDPFVRTYDTASPNPFNGVRQAYDSVGQYQSSTPIQRLKNGDVSINGVTGEVTVMFPSVTDAFPYLKSVDPDVLQLNYVYVGSDRMSSSGRAVELGNDKSAYVFSRYFDEADTFVRFTYDRPVPYGWYITAMLAGGLVILIFVLATRQKKKKPTLLDRFPYNPEEYRDYDSHLPMSR